MRGLRAAAGVLAALLALPALFGAERASAKSELAFAPEEQVRTAPDGSPLPGEPLPGAETGSDVPYWLAPLDPEPVTTPYWLQGPPPELPPAPSGSPPAGASPTPAPAPSPTPPPAPAVPIEPERGLFSPPEPPAPQPVEEPDPAKAPETPAPAGDKAAPSAPPEPNLGERREELSYYMFTDDQGVVHLTDAPADPRYRLFSIQVTVSSGLAPFRRLDIEKVRPLIMEASATYKVDPALIAAIIRAESAFDPKAVSWAGAQGLMQLMPSTARLVGCEDSFDPAQNIMGGTKYLRMMLNRFNGDVTLAVAAYNAGPERVARVMGVPAINETRNYVKVVLRNYEMFMTVLSP
jgi:hypothetical protein